MNALGALPGKAASDFPDGQLGKAQDGPEVLDEYRGKMSSMESVGEGVKPLGEDEKPLGEEAVDDGDRGEEAKCIVGMGIDDILD
ncbi:MAG: hypothetical protein M1822_001814, partial [Bathelium mastoideum]